MVNGWVERPIIEVLKPNGIKIGPFGSQLKKEMLLSDGVYRVYGQENVYARDFNIGDRYLTREHFNRLNSCEILPGDFVMSTMGTIGKCAIVPTTIQRGIMDSHLIRLRFDEKKVRSDYILQLFSDQFHYLSDQTSRLAVGGIMDGLSVGIVSRLNVIYPESIEEQGKIIKTLSEVDKLISDQQKLIRKKKDIRQGAMQMLVTGKKRLPGYYADFEHFTIGELGSLAKMSINPCQKPKTIFDEYSMPAFDDGAKPQQMLGELMLSSRIKLTPNTLLFNKLNVRQRRVWLVKDCSNNSVCSSEFLPYKSEKIDLSFLKQLLLTDKVTKDFEDMSSGTSNSQQRITPSDFLKYEISIPSLEEQRKIALILFDMDTEIQRLEEKLSKYQKVKQGMMEELLTGKVRLM